MFFDSSLCAGSSSNIDTHQWERWYTKMSKRIVAGNNLDHLKSKIYSDAQILEKKLKRALPGSKKLNEKLMKVS